MIDLNTKQVDHMKLSSERLSKLDTSNLDNDRLRKVSNDFESFFMQQMMDISLKSSKLAGEGTGADIIKGMYIETLSKKSSGTMGISDLIYNYLSKNNK